jgi:hypothetical protein
MDILIRKKTRTPAPAQALYDTQFLFARRMHIDQLSYGNNRAMRIRANSGMNHLPCSMRFANSKPDFRF